MNEIANLKTEIVISARPAKRGGITVGLALIKGGQLHEHHLGSVMSHQIECEGHQKLAEVAFRWLPKSGQVRFICDRYRTESGPKDGPSVEVDIAEAPIEVVRAIINYMVGLRISNKKLLQENTDVRSALKLWLPNPFS